MPKKSTKKINTDKLIKDIRDTIEKNANAKVVYGDPITKNGITIIPVAKTSVKGGGGGGFGDSKKEDQTGGGMGLGLAVNVDPMGYIKITNKQVKYEPIVDISRLAIIGAIAAALTAIVGILILSRSKKK